jgi:hypothetical protein
MAAAPEPKNQTGLNPTIGENDTLLWVFAAWSEDNSCVNPSLVPPDKEHNMNQQSHFNSCKAN